MGNAVSRTGDGVRSWARAFERNRSIALVYRSPAVSAIVLVLIIASITAPSFYTAANLADQLRLASILGIVTLGQMLVLLGRGFDLSVGAVMGLTATIVAQLGSQPALGITLALLAGLAVGALNAGLVVLRGVPPFIATLGALILVSGLRVAYTKGATSGAVRKGLHDFALGDLGPFATPLLLWLGLAVIVAAVLRWSVPGYWLYATGRNPRTARLSGVPVGGVVAATYLVSGLLAGLAGIVQAGYTGYVDQYLGTGVELSSIAAAVIGGTTFAGGEGGVGGTIAGAALLTILVNLVVLLNLGTAMQSIVQGAVLLVAIAIQALRYHWFALPVFRRQEQGS